MTWAEHTHGLKGTIVFASEIKPGDRLVYLERQSDLGNARPCTISTTERRGKTQVELNASRMHGNTLVLRLD